MTGYFPKARPLERSVKIELDLLNYATKGDLENATGVNTLKFAKKVDLVSLKSEIDQLDIGKLETTTVDLIKLSDAIKMKLLQKICMISFIKRLMLFRLSMPAI